MKKTLKITGIVLGCIVGIILLIGIIVFAGSEMMSAKYGVKNPTLEPGKTWIYEANFYGQEGNLINQDTLKLRIYNDRFLFTQNKLTWTLKKDGTTKYTGFVENQEKIWIHPIRFENYYEYTEYSAFPEIRFPLKEGRTWKAKLTLGSYATEESGSSVKVNYEIIGIDTLANKPLNRKVKILGKGKSDLGVYENKMIFSDSLGFEKFTYKKANDKKLVLKLIEKVKFE